MGLSSALNTALNGLGLNETAIDVIGNNIANAGTSGFKASQVQFETQLARTLSIGSSPNDATDSGGTNPKQVGLGAATAAILKDFGQGGITSTASPSDLAIEGDGFFIVDSPAGPLYTRDGGFLLDGNNRLVNNSGYRVQGYGVNDDFTLTTALADIQIPIGELVVAQETTNVSMSGALRTATTGDVGTQGSLLRSAALVDSSGGATAITAATALDSVFDGTTQLFSVGDEITFAPRKGDRTLDTQTFVVSAGDTVQQFLDFVKGTLGIMNNSDADVVGTIPNDASGSPPGVTVTAAGEMEILGNIGVHNDIDFMPSTFMKNGASFDELTFDKSQSADGESAFANFVVYDSLGDEVDLKISAALESRTGSSATYRYFFESFDDSRPEIGIASGTITFDSEGKPTGGDSQTITIQRADSNASTMEITVDFSNLLGIVAASDPSTLDLASQNGSEPGVLISFNIDDSGIINGVFDNGINRKLGQIVLARFRNPQGLLEAGRNTYQLGVSSGDPLLRTPGSGGAGTVRAGAVELSNTDVGKSLVDLIVASTNYRGNARVIGSVQALVDELLLLGR